MTKDVISLSISVLLLFRHYISHKITFGAPSSGGILCSACGAFIVLVDEGCVDPSSTISGPSSARQQNAIKWRFAGVLMMTQHLMLAR